MASDILKSGLSSSTTAAAHDTDDLADEASDSDQQGDQDCENNGRNDSDDDGDLYIDTGKSFAFITRQILDNSKVISPAVTSHSSPSALDPTSAMTATPTLRFASTPEISTSTSTAAPTTAFMSAQDLGPLTARASTPTATAESPTSVAIPTHSPTFPSASTTDAAPTAAMTSAPVVGRAMTSEPFLATSALTSAVPSQSTRRHRIRKAYVLQLNACTCGVTITNPEIQEGKTVMKCSTPGCETIWVSAKLTYIARILLTLRNPL
jgi:hypothetical protein